MTKNKNSNTTRDRILETSRQLFNCQGTKAVSTNHIAKEMGISPGNLYYHFRNKEEIIRELVIDYTRYFDSFYSHTNVQKKQETDLNQLVEMLIDQQHHSWRYRFYLRELLPLMQNDPILKNFYRSTRESRIEPMRQIFISFQQRGLIHIPDNVSLMEDLGRIIWMISHFWVSLVDMETDDPDSSHLIEGVRVIIRVLEPYLGSEQLDKAWEILARKAFDLES